MLVVVKDAISPVPEEAKPIPVLLFVQLMVDPGTEEVKSINVVVAPAHKVCVFGVLLTLALGLTIIVTVESGPVQLFAVEFTVIVAV